MTTVGKQTCLEHQHHPTSATPSGQDLSWPSHPIKTNTYKPSYHGQILMDLHEIFSIVPQWAKRHEGNCAGLASNHLNHSSWARSNTIIISLYSLSALCTLRTTSQAFPLKFTYISQIMMDLHETFSVGRRVGKQTWIEHHHLPTLSTPSGHDLSRP